MSRKKARMEMNDKCAECIHCEVCGFIESEVAKDGACDFYEDGKPKFIAKSDGTIEQIKNCDDCIFRKEWEKIGKLLSVILKKQTEQEPILDKIRAEIAEYGSIMVSYAITKDTKTDKGIEKLVSGVLKQAKEQVLEIIDKYRTESEAKE